MSDALFETEIGEVRISITRAEGEVMTLDFDLLDRSQSSRRELPVAEGFPPDSSLEFTPIKGSMSLTAGNKASVELIVSKLRLLADAMEQLSK